jgi:short-subunit dehydrogenase
MEKRVVVITPGIHVSAVIPGVVATDFGLNAKHGGMDSRALPGAQPVDEVAEVIVDLIDHPRAEVYTRPAYKQQVAAYYAAEDLGELESKPPFSPAR